MGVRITNSKGQAKRVGFHITNKRCPAKTMAVRVTNSRGHVKAMGSASPTQGTPKAWECACPT